VISNSENKKVTSRKVYADIFRSANESQSVRMQACRAEGYIHPPCISSVFSR